MKITVELPSKKGKITIEGSTTQEILNELDNVEKIVGKISSWEQQLPERAAREEVLEYSSTEFLSSSKANKISDKMMVLFYYLWKIKEEEIINVIDLKQTFKEVMEPLPANPTGLMRYLQKKGYIQPRGKKDKFRAWGITRKGKEYVEKELLETTEES
ncbi:MAG: hypothetical protein ACE5KE_09660 [Methanosarcinales archaeon]